MRKQIVNIIVLIFLIASAFCQEARPHHFISRGPFGLADLRSRSAGTASFFLSPVDLYSIYNVPYGPDAGANKTIAIVVAYGASTCEADFGNITSLWGIPACTTANGCFRRVNQTGGTIYPPDDASWSTEAALDLTATHTMAWGAKKLMVVANSGYSGDMFAAIAYAAQHADYVTMSFGWAESQSIPALQNYASLGEPIFSAAGGPSFFASTGDVGLLSYPSSSAHVISVGGTSLNVSTANNAQLLAETGWDGSGGGCSNISIATTYQAANPGYASLGCKGYRAAPDVAFPAQLSSGVVIYMSVGCTTPGSCYYQSGGTSLATPLFAARSAIRKVRVDSEFVYGGNILYRDITSGATQYLSAKPGLDLVTGLGAWIGDTTPPSPSPASPSTPTPATSAPTPQSTTSTPTPQPATSAPTVRPAVAPTKAPTSKPSAVPTKTPTPKPATLKPATATPKPPTPKPATAVPSPKPPTVTPTPSPTISPTVQPSLSPTTPPTAQPSATSAPSSSLGYLINKNFATSALTATSLLPGATITMAPYDPSAGPTILQRWMYDSVFGYIYLRDYPSIVIGAQNISDSATAVQGTFQVTPSNVTSSGAQNLNQYTQQTATTYYIFRNKQVTDHVLSVPIAPSGNKDVFGETYVNNAWRQMWSWGSFQCPGNC